MRHFAVVLICSAALLAACAGPDGPRGVFMPERELLADPYGAFADSGPYRLATGDRIRVVVFGQDSLTNAYTVDATGRISVPLIGQVAAMGRTTQEVEREIAARLANGYIRQPNVSAEVELYRPFFIMGEVTTSGQYPYVNAMTVQNAVAIAGGFGPRANRHSIEISRKINGLPMKAVVPLTYLVRPGDILTIKERWF